MEVEPNRNQKNNNNERKLIRIKDNNKFVAKTNKKMRTKAVVNKIKSKDHFIYLWKEKGQYYLPPVKFISWHYVSQIIAGEKKLLKISKVGSIFNLPKAKGLCVNSLFEEMQEDIDFLSYFPDFSESIKIPKTYFINV